MRINYKGSSRKLVLVVVLAGGWQGMLLYVAAVLRLSNWQRCQPRCLRTDRLLSGRTPDAYGRLPLEFARDRPRRSGDGPAPWPGSLPGPWFLARVLPEAQCQGWPKVISGGNAKRLDIERKHATIQGPSPGLSLAAQLLRLLPALIGCRAFKSVDTCVVRRACSEQSVTLGASVSTDFRCPKSHSCLMLEGGHVHSADHPRT